MVVCIAFLCRQLVLPMHCHHPITQYEIDCRRRLTYTLSMRIAKFVVEMPPVYRVPAAPEPTGGLLCLTALVALAAKRNRPR